MTGGGFRVEVPNVGTLSTSASVKPVASKSSTATSFKPLGFSMTYPRGSDRWKGLESNVLERAVTLTHSRIPQDLDSNLQHHQHTAHCGTSISDDNLNGENRVRTIPGEIQLRNILCGSLVSALAAPTFPSFINSLHCLETNVQATAFDGKVKPRVLVLDELNPSG
jgi:hypothetical protein